MSQPAGPSTLGECLAAAAADRPAAEALVYGEQRLSWGDYALRVAALARGLLALGLRPAERIAIYLPNCPDYLLAFLAAARIGAITLALNPQYTPREVVHLLGQTGPRLLLTSAELYTPALATALARCCSGLQVILAGAGARGRPGLANVIAAGDALPKHALARRGAAVRPEDGAFIVATGGINGRIKGALLTHANILAAVQAQVSHLDFGADDRLLLHLPLNHVSGALILGAASILSGAAAVIQPQFRPQEALALIARERITLLGQVPTMYSLELAVPDFGRYDLSSLRMCIVAGAPTPAALMARLHTLAPRTVHGYGLSEAAGFATFSLAEDDLPTLSATAGRPLPGVELRTLDPDGRPLPAGASGEIALRGRQVMAGYYGEPEETAEALGADGWLRTGDLGWLDDNGYLRLAGLKKDMFLCGGYNVYPREIEEFVLRLEGVAACACLGVPHAVMGQVGALFVAPHPGRRLNPADVQAHCRSGLARYKQPAAVSLRGRLPLAADGRVDKAALAAEWETGERSRLDLPLAPE